jgi:predicted dinucleotide-binding enzyme
MDKIAAAKIDRRSFLGLGVLSAATAIASLPAFGQGAAPLKIGIIGSGRIGGTIGSLWVKAGHQVLFSSRHPEELKGMVDGLGPLARAGQVAEAATFGDVIFIAVPYAAFPQIGKDYASLLAGKVMLDASNAVERRDGDITNEVKEAGIGVTSSKYFPGAKIVRAFNTMGYTVFQNNAHRPGDKLAVPIAGDEQAALDTASRLIRDAGFEPVVIGPLARASLFQQGGPLYGVQTMAADLRKRASELK